MSEAKSTFRSQRILPMSAAAFLCAGCITAGPGSEGLGSVSIALSSVPEDVGCISILAMSDLGSTVSHYDVAEGEEFSTIMDGLPYGPVQFSGESFAEACSDISDTSIPTWVASAVTASVDPGIVNVVTLVMRRNGRICVEVTFEDDFSTPGNGSDGSACGLPADRGPCDAYLQRWYFNADAGECQRFIYGGCGGNENNFTTLRECEARCSIEPQGGCARSVCELPPGVAGPCDGRLPRWSFDAELGRCRRFFYSGCGGNENSFATLTECEGTCDQPEPVNRCGRTECTVEQECRVFEETGEEYCADSCDLKRCPTDQVCELQDVICVREPCPPIARCVALRR